MSMILSAEVFDVYHAKLNPTSASTQAVVTDIRLNKRLFEFFILYPLLISLTVSKPIEKEPENVAFIYSYPQ